VSVLENAPETAQEHASEIASDFTSAIDRLFAAWERGSHPSD